MTCGASPIRAAAVLVAPPQSMVSPAISRIDAFGVGVGDCGQHRAVGSALEGEGPREGLEREGVEEDAVVGAEPRRGADRPAAVVVDPAVRARSRTASCRRTACGRRRAALRPIAGAALQLVGALDDRRRARPSRGCGRSALSSRSRKAEVATASCCPGLCAAPGAEARARSGSRSSRVHLVARRAALLLLHPDRPARRTRPLR